MSFEPYQQMIVTFSAGLGLCLLGGANAFLRRNTLLARAAASVVVAILMSGVAFAATGETGPAQAVVLILGAVYGGLSLVGSEWLSSAVSRAIAFARRPAVRWGVVGSLGFAAAIGSVVHSEEEFYREADRQMVELDLLTVPPPWEAPTTRAVTDFGREVSIKEATVLRGSENMLAIEEAILNHKAVRDNVIRCQPASDRTNCHGWVFTGGRYWVSGSEVDRILTENGYQSTTEPRPGDLAIYRADNSVTHTAVVRYTAEGQPVLVEGKWGCSAVYLHAVDKSVYGTTFTYYRSARSGHVLAGIQSVDPQNAQGSPHVVPDPANPNEFTE